MGERKLTINKKQMQEGVFDFSLDGGKQWKNSQPEEELIEEHQIAHIQRREESEKIDRHSRQSRAMVHCLFPHRRPEGTSLIQCLKKLRDKIPFV